LSKSCDDRITARRECDELHSSRTRSIEVSAALSAGARRNSSLLPCVYRLGSDDLEFAELLPETEDVGEEGEYDSQSRLAFQLGRIATALSGLRHAVFKLSPVDSENTADAPDAP
jgi:hypothetical protein